MQDKTALRVSDAEEAEPVREDTGFDGPRHEDAAEDAGPGGSGYEGTVVHDNHAAQPSTSVQLTNPEDAPTAAEQLDTEDQEHAAGATREATCMTEAMSSAPGALDTSDSVQPASGQGSAEPATRVQFDSQVL